MYKIKTLYYYRSQEPWENDEEDDMIAEAFEEFLAFSQNNNKANQKNVQTRNSNQHQK